MSDNVDRRLRDRWLSNGRQSAHSSEPPIDASPLPTEDGMMDELTRYRQDYADKRMDKLEVVAEKLTDEMSRINVALAKLPTKDTITGWGVAIILAVFASAIALAGVLLTSSNNQIAAFQAGMSATQVAPALRPTPSH